jgi:DNA-binding PadR family transcriptional regulator
LPLRNGEIVKLEYIILGLLTANPCTGYDIKKFLDTEARFGQSSRPLSQIYNTLKRMVANDWVEFEVIPRDRKPDLKVYHLTDQGRKYFIKFLHKPMKLSFRYRESELPIRVIYSYLVEPDVILDHLKRELNFRKEQIATFRNRDRTIKSSLLEPWQVELANEVFEILHLTGAKGIDDYVAMLETLIVYFENRQKMKN